MAKPVFIVKFPKEHLDIIDREKRDSISKVMNDYHLLFIPIENSEFQFECYNSEKANELDFEILQKRVLEIAKL